MTSGVNALNGISPVNTFQYNPYFSYDLDYADLDMSTYPMMGMNGSIFNGYMGNGMMPFTPGFYGNNQSYFDNMKDYQKFYIDYNIDQQKMQRNADLKTNASVEGIFGAASVLKDKILQNEQDQIPKAFQAYVDSVARAYGEASPQELKSRALSLYAQMNDGKSLIQDLRENSHGSFTQGFIQSLTFGAYYQNSAEDNISNITGQPVGTGEKTLQNIGRIGGATAVSGLTYALTKNIAKLKGKAGIIGLATGAIAGTISFLTGKATT